MKNNPFVLFYAAALILVIAGGINAETGFCRSIVEMLSYEAEREAFRVYDSLDKNLAPHILMPPTREDFEEPFMVLCEERASTIYVACSDDNFKRVKSEACTREIYGIIKDYINENAAYSSYLSHHPQLKSGRL